MTQNRRLFWNVLATYGRSLYALVCGLFTSRWVLLSLGEVDFGLYGVVGGLVFFVTFINSLLATSVGRFFAYTVGAAQKEVDESIGLEACRKWFSTAVLIHLVVPALLVLVGYPIGIWAVEHFLTIPSDRVEMCVWLWRFACVSCFISMFTVPFQAMYTAKQEIAELTIYSVIGTTLTVGFLGYMVTHPRTWLVLYALGMMLITSIPQLVICVMSFCRFKECRINVTYLFDLGRLKAVFSFAGCQLIRALAKVLSTQGLAILVNKVLGPSYNAAMTIGNAVTGHANTFSSSIMSSFYPAITNAAGAGNLDLMRRLTYRSCSLASLVILVFALPLIIEIDEVLHLWLVHPPEQAGLICVCALISNIISQMTQGCWMSIYAVGQIARFQMVGVLVEASVIGVSVLCLLGFHMRMGGVGIALVVMSVVATVVHLIFASSVSGISVRRWMKDVLLPILLSGGVVTSIGLLVRSLMDQSFLRLFTTTFVMEMVYLPLAWFIVLSKEDRLYLKGKYSGIRSKIRNSEGRFRC